MPKVLIVEDSKTFASMVGKKISTVLEWEISWAKNLAEAKEILEQEADSFFAALLDLNLPDAPHGEVVDYVVSKGIPSIIFTGELSDELRDSIVSKQVVDYVLKDSIQSLDYLVDLLARIQKNMNVKVLVVDDSQTARTLVSSLLQVHKFQVLEAQNGKEALELLKDNADVKLVITDYNMPEMDGFELTKEIRQSFTKEQLAIIGISAHNNPLLTASFIKKGANDFLTKPFYPEEFYCRVTHNVEMIEHIQAVKDAANRDYLTGLYNRRFLMQTGRMLHANAERNNLNIAVALMDVDFFKKVNDTYGHDAGDEVLRFLSQKLKTRFRDTDVVARFGGEEFIVVLSNPEQDQVTALLEGLRDDLERSEIVCKTDIINITISIGVCTSREGSLEDMISVADERLYEAKTTGRNKIVAD